MFTKDDHDFLDMLFGKLTKHVDMEEIDLGDDDTCCDHLELEQLTSLETVPDEATGWN